jgi:hypothetical protein
MIRLLVLLAQAGSVPTVGDTVWVERILGNVRGAIVRPQEWDLGNLGVQLGPAVVSHGEAGARVRYPVVLWYPGDRTLTMPGPVLVYPDGTSDTLPASVHRVRRASVLPPGQPRRSLAPQPPRTPLPLASRSLVPLAVLLGASGLLIGGIAARWRRQGKPAGRPAPPGAEPSVATLNRWVERGEYRAALHYWGWRLARRMRTSQDLADIAALQSLLEEIGDAAFVPDHPERFAALAARAAALGKE